MIYEFLIDDSNQNARLDVFLANVVELSRSEIQKLIDDKKVLVNGKIQKKNYKLNLNDKITLDYEKPDKTIKAQKQDLDIVYEDDLSLIHISEPTRQDRPSRMPSSA